jgi:hypothetical protein
MSGYSESAYTLAFQGFYKRRIIIRDIALVHVHSSSVVQHLLFKSPSAHFDSLPEKLKKLIVRSAIRSTVFRGALVLHNTTIYISRKQYT